MEFNLDQSISILSKTPKLIRDLLSNIPEEWALNNEGEGSWSPYDIIGHFIHGEKTDWIPRSRIILGEQEDKSFVPFDRFAQEEESKGKSLEKLLDEFENLRQENIESLKGFHLNEELLNKTGIHPEFGEVNLRQLLATWTIHDLVHINQMTRVMAKNYTQAIGPWRNYMKLLQ